VSFPRSEVEDAFRRYLTCGIVNEDWDAWSRCFTPDVEYHEHQLGSMQGRDAVLAWIAPLMDRFPEIYNSIDWYVIDGDRVVFDANNRRDNPEAGGDPIDFSGVTILQYAGDGMFCREDDWWDMNRAMDAAKRYAELCARFDPDHPQKRTRLGRTLPFGLGV
jgi:SnoaL-like domain